MDRLRFRGRFVAVFVASLALFGALSLSALAAPGGGNAAASAACEEGGYLNWTDADGNAFKNEGACVRYAAQGGQLVAVVGEPTLSVSTSAIDGSPHACFVTVSVANFPADAVLIPTFTDYWFIVADNTLQQVGAPWPSPQSIPLDASGSGSLNFISPNAQVDPNTGNYVVTKIDVDFLSWGPDHIAC